MVKQTLIYAKFVTTASLIRDTLGNLIETEISENLIKSNCEEQSITTKNSLYRNKTTGKMRDAMKDTHFNIPSLHVS